MKRDVIKYNYLQIDSCNFFNFPKHVPIHFSFSSPAMQTRPADYKYNKYKYARKAE